MYQYPDYQDKITGKMIAQIELFRGYWSKSEERLLRKIEKRYLPKRKTHLLDLGCGEGRLTLRFGAYFANITAIEPDTVRIETAKKNVLEKNQNVTFFCGLLQDYPIQEQYDFILCSHIIQHISKEQTNRLLRDIFKALAPGGRCVILTTHSKRSDTYYIQAKIQEGNYIEEEISEKEFHGILGQKDVLPTVMFEIADLVNQIEAIGFKMVAYNVFHLDNKNMPYICINDTTANFFECLKRKQGRDMMIVVEK